jgi:predicted  nucleic acid-binding Zn-ribbon protein
MRQELDAAADQVRAMVTEIAELTTERDAARWQSAVQFVTLTRERDQWHRRADVALSAGESARAGLAAATALVHDMDARNAELRRQLADRDAELADMESQRDQAIYERDSARVAS